MVNKTAEIYNHVIKLYQTELMQTADNLEKKRKIFVLVNKIITTLIVLGGILAVPFSFAALGLGGDDNLNIFLFVLVWAGFVLVSIYSCVWTFRTIIFNFFSAEVKSELFDKIYKSLDANLTYFPGKFKFPTNMYNIELCLNSFRKPDNSFLLEQQIEKLKIFPEYDYIRVDDSILGTYNGHEVQVIEFSLIDKRVHYSSKGGRTTKYVEVFHGALFQTSMEKHINANVFIKQKGSNLTHPSILKRVNLESNEFEKIFEVYSHDQIEARYFLNTATMDKLININNSGQKISSYVCGKSISVLIHSSKDMFEPDMNKPVNNPNNYFELIFQAKSILDMITQLNLESKTGL